MKVYVVRGRHGELEVFADSEDAFAFWAKTNRYDSFYNFLDDFTDEVEISEGHWFLDEGGQVNLVEVR